MIPVRLALENFLSYASPPPLELSDVEVACLSGPNGAGKSALLDAITWACWGQARGCEGGQNQDRLIREGAEATCVDFTFELAAETYRIVRRRAAGKRSDLQFMVADGEGWTNIAGESLRETEAKISSVLRMDYETFVASALFVQGRADNLLRMSPQERKEVFSSLLGLGVYERLEDAARVKAREAEARRGVIAQRAEQLAADAAQVEPLEKEVAGLTSDLEEAQLAEAELAEAAEAQRTAVGELEKTSVVLGAERQALQAAQKALESARAGVEKTAKELGAIDRVLERREELEQAKTASEELAKTREYLSVQVAAEAGAGERIRALEAELGELGRKAELLAGGGGECPLCGGSLEGGHRERVRASIEAQTHQAATAMEKARSAREDAHKEARRATEAIGRLEQVVSRSGKLEGTIDQAERSREVVVQRLAEFETQAREAEAELEARRTSAATLEAELGGLEKAKEGLRAALGGLEKARRRREELAAQSARLAERLEAARKAEAGYTEARRDEVEAAKTGRRFKRLAEAFGRGGIPDLIIDNARPELEHEANQVLGELSGQEMSVHFQLQRETRSGKARDTFDVQVFADGGLRDFAMFSGGEAFRIAFAVRLAMSKLLTRRAGASLQTLVIDEGFGTQDPEGRERLVEAINLARTEFSKVLVITHMEDLRDQFGTQVRVYKGPDGSTYELEGELRREG